MFAGASACAAWPADEVSVQGCDKRMFAPSALREGIGGDLKRLCIFVLGIEDWGGIGYE